MSPARFRTGAVSDVGRVRSMNEDAYVVTDVVFAVADGMGGHLAGEVASAMAVDALSGLVSPLGATDAVDAVLAANAAILEMSRTDASRRGMGTTLTAIAAVGDEAEPALAVVNVGDSRTYRWRAGVLEQVSVDHSYVQELVNGGHITADEARYHPQRNIVTRALGIESRLDVDVFNLPAVRGDRYLLCSDGLVDEVSDDEIAELLSQHPDPQAAAQALVDRANASGGRDNVTVVVLDVVEGLEPPTVTAIDASVHATKLANSAPVPADPSGPAPRPAAAVPAAPTPVTSETLHDEPRSPLAALLGRLRARRGQVIAGAIVTALAVIVAIAVFSTGSSAPAPTTTVVATTEVVTTVADTAATTVTPDTGQTASPITGTMTSGG
jgi:protein phosphatase